MRLLPSTLGACVLLAFASLATAKDFVTSVVPQDRIDVLKVYAILAGISYETLTSWDCASCAFFADTQLADYFHSNKNRTFGYVAVNNPLRQVVVAFRGTDNAEQYLTDINLVLKRWPDSVEDSKVHDGFLDSYQDVADNLYELAAKELANNPNYNLTIIGHSLGGGVASLAGVDFVMRNKTLGSIMRVVTFGKPRVGNQEYIEYYNSLNITTDRVVNKNDIVPHLPGNFLGYRHEAGEQWIKFESNGNLTLSCPQVDNKSNPDCSKSVRVRDYSREQHHWAWNIQL
ncbi:hypothetical protein IWQ60_005666 [Tieghemiomyces parasiticus]|uniref:Fungal lipase-type domain-containing protein n=1 Tax=Tieghemiomyces parasiticus TaxID=78921 RepID=A0A9W8ABC2_9FUNG|nr:hypothetical protein IWQ60_005666 [Tieghemiomyces parasiticus]